MKRVRLQFDRNPDIRTEFYYVYRATVSPVTKRSSRIMKIGQVAKPNPIHTEDEAIRQDARIYQLKHRGVFKEYPLIVSVNGVPLIDPVYQVDYQRGILLFDEALNETDVVSVSYYFDGIEVMDDFATNADLDLNYYGPPAEDYSKPPAPDNVSILPISNGVEIHYRTSTHEGQTFSYAIEARNETGSYSQLSPAFSINLKDSFKEVVIEASTDGGATWKDIGTTTDMVYQDMKADQDPPEGLTDVAYVVAEDNEAITLTWHTPLTNERVGMTPRYRVRSRLMNGELSAPSATVGPEAIQSELDKVVIYRTRINEPHPVFGSTTAEVFEQADYNSGLHQHPALPGNTYRYSLFVVDKAGNHSLASLLTINT